jgi:MoaD family protein
VRVLYFAAARDVAATGEEEIAGWSVGEVLDRARSTRGDAFSRVLSTCRIWLNGDPASSDDKVKDGDEVAVLPPVSGGASA